MRHAAYPDVVTIDKRKDMEALSVSVLRAFRLEIQAPQAEIQLLVLAENQFLPSFAGRGHARPLDDIVRTLRVMDHGCRAMLGHVLLTKAGVDRPLLSVEVQTEIVVHLVGVGTDREGADLKDDLVAS